MNSMLNFMMRAQSSSAGLLQNLVIRHPVKIYFAATFAISWFGALAVAAPALLHEGSVPRMAGLTMFPAMLLGPCLTGIALPVSPGKVWPTGAFYANEANPRRTLVCRPAYSSKPDFDGPLLLENACLSSLFAEQIPRRYCLWHDCWISRRNWVDGLRFPGNISATVCASSRCLARLFLGTLAPACNRFPWYGDTSQFLLAAILWHIHSSRDSHESRLLGSIPIPKVFF